MPIEKLESKLLSAVALGLGITGGAAIAAEGYAGPYGFGTTPTEAEIAAIDIDAMGDGRGLPPGSGTYEEGRVVYEGKCSACHGENMEGVGSVSAPRLIGGRGTIGDESSIVTIESFWPYAPTVFDYVKRTMPFNAPGSLTDDELYAVVAYILGEANIIDHDLRLDAETLAAVEMPNRDGFIPDSRPDVFNFD
jgi:cytochrome c5